MASSTPSGILLNPLNAPTLAITYCSIAEVQAVWSVFGVAARLDDDLDGAPELNQQVPIEQACSLMNRFLFKRYSAATIAASTWAKWCAATLAAVVLARRRGNAVPDDLQKEADDYRDVLKEIRAGREDLIADDGPATPVSDELMAVSNLAIDGRWLRAKVRRVDSTSTGGPQNNNGLKQNNTIDYVLWE
ncbi:MAG TPA: hypothetical protein VHC22_32495 [Pirellulales bacterium]|nr:hypothetical protein [Pirellulales bacterium]